MASIVGSCIRAAADRNTEAGSVEWRATSDSATSQTWVAPWAGARRCRTPIRARRASSLMDLHAFTAPTLSHPIRTLVRVVGIVGVHPLRVQHERGSRRWV